VVTIKIFEWLTFQKSTNTHTHTHTHTHDHFTALWTLSGTTRVSWY